MYIYNIIYIQYKHVLKQIRKHLKYLKSMILYYLYISGMLFINLLSLTILP